MPPVNLASADSSTRGATWLRMSLVCAVVVGGLLLAGVIPLGASFVPFGFLLAKTRGMSMSGQTSFFTLDFYRAIQLRLRFIAGGNLLVAAGLLLFRRKMHQFAARASADSHTLAGDMQSAARLLRVSDMLAIGCLMLVTAYLRISLLAQPMRYDEAYTFVMYASHPFYAALSFYNFPNNHLFHTLLVRIAYLLLGNHPWALRLPAFFAGLGLVPATYVASRSLYGGGGALPASGLVAASSVLIEYSTEARGYSMVGLIYLVMIPLAAYCIRRHNRASWCLLAALSALGFYTIPIMLYPFGGIVVWLLLSAAIGDAGPSLRSMVSGAGGAVALAGLVTLELYSPVFAISGPRAVLANKWVTASPLAVFLHGLPSSLLSTWQGWNRDIPTWLTWALAAGFAASLLWNHRRGKFRVPLALALVLWIAPVVLLQRVIPFERVWMFALPLYFIVATAGLGAAVTPLLDRLRLPYAMAGFAIVAALLLGLKVQSSQSIYRSNEGRGLESLTLYLKGRLKPGDSVVATPPSDAPLYYYFQKAGIPLSSLNAGAPHRRLVVVNGVTGDTVEKVLEMSKIANPRAPAKLLIVCDSASLYEME